MTKAIASFPLQFTALLLVLAATTAPAKAAPLAEGDTAAPVTLKGLDGADVNLGEVYGQGRTVLVMLRGFPGYQCPLCTRQVGELRAKAAEFASAGVRVVLVYPGKVDDLAMKANEFVGPELLPEPISMVIDPDYELTNAYGLRWDAANETAYPAAFILAQGGKVTWAKVSDSHGGRASAEEILAALAE